MSVVYSRATRGDLDQVEARLQASIVEQGYGVLGSIDLKDRMAQKGVELEPSCRVFEVCNPHKAKGVLERDMSIATALPCRVAIYESGDELVIGMMRPTAILAQFEQPGLEGEAQQVERDLIAAIDRAALAS